ncbi:MAG TPA: exodeoxyribonuclease V subunit gamma, partial [Ramlibacter sp.]|nr:exodeoxyribonuclease V subunit gamma [Ramlibacter sp.]
MQSPAPLTPGFMVVHGNHPESLRELMVAWMARNPLAPLENELVLVQSNGVAQWLKLSLAAAPAQGGV